MVSAIVRAGVPAYKGWEGRLPAGSGAGNCVKDTAPGWRMGHRSGLTGMGWAGGKARGWKVQNG